MSNYTVQLEPLSSVLPELRPLLGKHWEEVAWYQDEMKLEPMWDLYIEYEKKGILHLWTARDEDNVLIGYSIYFLVPSLHYGSHAQAQNDIFYVVPEHRGTGVAAQILNEATDYFRDAGASVITLKMKSDNTFHKLMDSVEYQLMEHNYTKYIGDK